MPAASGGDGPMQFLLLRASDEATESGQPPVEPWLDLMLRPGSEGASVEFRDGHARVVPGSSSGVSGGVAGLSSLEAASLDAAVAVVHERLAANAAGDGPVEVEVREAGCPGGLDGVAPIEPERGLSRFVVLLKSVGLEQGFVPGPDLLEPMARRNDEATRAGVMLAGDGLQPSRRGARVRRAGRDRLSVVDGPFAEAKELVAGYWLIQVPSLDDAIRWVQGYPYPVRDHCDVEIRPVI